MVLVVLDNCVLLIPTIFTADDADDADKKWDYGKFYPKSPIRFICLIRVICG